MIRPLHRSPDASELYNVSVDHNGMGIVNLNAPSIAPVAADPLTPAVPVPTAPPAGLRIENIVAQMAEKGTATVVEEVREAQADDAPAPSGDSAESVGAPVETGEPAALVFAAPPRTPDGEPVSISVENQEQLEALQRLQNGYARRETLATERKALVQERAEQQAFTQRLEADPIGFIVDNLPLEVQGAVAEVLVARLAETMGARFDELLGSEVTRKEALLNSREQRQQWEVTSQEKTETEVYRDAVFAGIEALIPESASDEDRTEFFDDARVQISEHIRRGGAVDPTMVPQFLAAKVRRFGFDKNPPAPPTAAPMGATPPVAAPKAPVPAVPTVKPAVPLTQAQMIARGAAAAVVPAGAGAVPSTAAAPPKGMRIEDAASWYRNRAATAAS